MEKITVYSTATCVYCHALMDWLDSEGIEYEEKDSTDPKLEMEILERIGHEIEIVPTTVIGDKVITGFHRPAIKRALKKLNEKE